MLAEHSLRPRANVGRLRIAWSASEEPVACLRLYWDTTFVVELFILGLSAPVLYAPSRFGQPAIALAIALLAGSWLWRRLQTGEWYRATPADIPVFLLLFILLPISIWAAPEPVRSNQSWPRALVLLWNLQLFSVIVTHNSRRWRLLVPSLAIFMGAALLIALVAVFGTNWLFKFPRTEPLLARLPLVFSGLSREGESGFHPNIIAGALLYILPLMISVTIAGFRPFRRRRWFWLLATGTLYVLTVFMLLQSRGGYAGLTVALLAMPALHHRLGRWLLAIGAAVAMTALILVGGPLLEQLEGSAMIEAMGGVTTLQSFRMQMWSNAVLAIQDFPITGLGLGAFQEVGRLLYPFSIPPNYYFGHAHNFWLQGTLDFGLPGLITILAIYIVVIVQLVRLWRVEIGSKIPGLVTGLTGCVIAQSIFSLTDSISMGSTANFLFWYLLALVLALGNLAVFQQGADASP